MTDRAAPPDDQRAFNLRLLDALDALNIPYAIGGSFAAMAYSEPRMTNDIDVMIVAGIEDLAHLVDVVDQWEVYISPLEAILEIDLPHGLPINIVDALLGGKADLFVAGRTALDAAAMSRRRRKRFYRNPDVEAWFLSPEDVILYKLDYFRRSGETSAKHPADIAKMLRVMGDQLDLAYLERGSAEIGVGDLWAAMWDEHSKLSAR
jgi:hypothetical protein